MRIALIDLLFSWPPHGGADVDVYHVAQELSRLGYDAHVFFARDASCWERGRADTTSLPFPSSRLDFSEGEFTASSVVSRFQKSMQRFEPDVIVLAQGYFLKPFLIHGLSAYPVFSRCYAHETACHKGILRFRDGAPCPHSYVENPERCRRCALAHLGSGIAGEHTNAWTQEYLAAKAWSTRYYALFTSAMKQLRGIIITTGHMRGQVEKLCDHIHVIPHGVDCKRFTPAPGRHASKKPALFMPGRVEDPAKGFAVLMEAATTLVEAGYDFEVRATIPEGHPGPSWLKPTGKLDYAAMPGAYQEADICVVPSIWEEPFGIVALEAMASGIPVCASQTGGLQDIVVHETTGLLSESGNAEQLAAHLRLLLEDEGKRRAMGAAGRKRAQERYQWKDLVAKHYPPLFADSPDL